MTNTSYTSLVVCHTESDLRLITKAADEADATVVVATSSSRIRMLAHQHPRVDHAIYLDQMVSLFDVTQDALVLFEQINAWLRAQSTDEPACVLEWSKHVEGGMMTQRLADILIATVSCLRIFNEYQVTSVYLRRGVSTRFEDDVLALTATHRGIPVIQQWDSAARLFHRWDLRPVELRAVGRTFYLSLPQVLLNRLLLTKLVIDILRHRLFRKRGHAAGNRPCDEVFFLLGSSADKHVDNISPAMTEFNRREGYRSRAFCWQAAGGAIKLRNRGLQADNIEAWIGFRRFTKAWRRYRLARRAVTLNLGGFLTRGLVYRNIPIGELLIPSFRHFVTVTLPGRILMHEAFEALYSETCPAAMKSYGGVRLDLGRIACDTLKTHSQCRSLTFHYWLGINMSYRFGTPPSPALDLLFVHGDSDKTYVNQLAPGLDVVVAGYPRMSYLESYQHISQSDALHALRIHTRRKYVFLYASAGVINGYISQMEADLLVASMLRIADAQEHISIMLKPHPSESSEYIRAAYLQQGKPDNVVVLERSASIYHCIKAADIVVTSFSTVGLEAMLLGRPVVSLSYAGQSRLQDIFGDGAEKFQNHDAFADFIARATASESIFRAWTAARLQAQSAFLPRKIWQPTRPVEQIIVDEVISRLNNSLKKEDVHVS